MATVRTFARAFKQAGFQVSGTAAGKDGRCFASCSDRPVLDFACAGSPTTCMFEVDGLLAVYPKLDADLARFKPDNVLIELECGVHALQGHGLPSS